MSPILTCDLPQDALLRRYQREGVYTDCYMTEIPLVVSPSAYVEGFYTTTLFKVERRILSWFLRRPSTDDDARELALGRVDAFAAWHVEERTNNQLLLSDFKHRTRSWLLCEPDEIKGFTRLYFGSAVVPIVDRRTGETRMGIAFRLLLGFHQHYSRALLRAAVSHLQRIGSITF
jgi:hypothetical protein